MLFSRRSLDHSCASFQLLLIIFFYGHHFAVAAGARIFIYGSCSQDHYEPNSLFETNLNSFLSSVATSASESIYNSFSIGNAPQNSPDDAVYGLYQCRGDLRIADCSRCVGSVVTQMGSVCPTSYGAALQLEGCYVRYERVNFLGKLDTSLKYKKCSRHGDDDVEFFRRRDDVLADLQTAVGFKVSSSGLVEGFAQCLGDLSSSDCALCLAEAVGELKNLCGSAAAADVFLAQCYARYWASGYYEDSGSSHHQDHFGRTIAVLVGSLAGLAVLVILLSVCRTRGNKK